MICQNGRHVILRTAVDNCIAPENWSLSLLWSKFMTDNSIYNFVYIVSVWDCKYKAQIQDFRIDAVPPPQLIALLPTQNFGKGHAV